MATYSLGGLGSSNALPILSYCASSIVMTVTNKYVLSGLNFNLNFLLVAVQSLVCVVAISIAKAFSMIDFRQFDVDEARKWFPIAVLLTGMIYTGSKALQFLSIPVYTIFKNLTIIFIAYGEVLWFGGSVTPMILASFGLIVLSSVVAAWADIQAASHPSQSVSGVTSVAQLSILNAGYMWMLANCFCNASFVLGLRKRIKLTKFKDFDTMFYNNLLSVPIQLICSLCFEDWSSVNLERNFPSGSRDRIIFAMVVSGILSAFISYTSAWCVRVTSSTTYSMTGALNKLPLALSGLIFFDAPVTIGSVSAIALGFVSGLLYTVAKIRQKKEQDQQQSLPTAASDVDVEKVREKSDA